MRQITAFVAFIVLYLSPLSNCVPLHAQSLESSLLSTLLQSTTMQGMTASPSIGVFATLPSMNVARAGHAVTKLLDGRILVTGGTTPSGITASAEMFDLTTGKWTAIASMSKPRTFHSAGLLADGRVLVYGVDSVLGDFEIYDPKTDSWDSSFAPPLGQQERPGKLLPLPNGKFFIAIAGGGFVYRAWNLFDPLRPQDANSDAWCYLQRIAVDGRNIKLTVLNDGRILVTGNTQSTDLIDYRIHSTVCPGGSGQNPGTAGPRFAVRHAGPSDTKLPDGRIVFLGGTSGEIFDPTTNSFLPLIAMKRERSSHNAFLLADGRILLVGGGSSTGLVKTPEVFDPSNNSFTDVSIFNSHLVAGTGRQLIELNNGMRLLIGGWLGDSATITKAVHIFLPNRAIIKVAAVSGANMLTNPVDNRMGNYINDLMPLSTAHQGSTVWKFDASDGWTLSSTLAAGTWEPNVALAPGEGFWLSLRGPSTDLNFSGYTFFEARNFDQLQVPSNEVEVLGTTVIKNGLLGYAGIGHTAGFRAQNGDMIMLADGTSHVFEAGIGWAGQNPFGPVLKPGIGYMLFRADNP